jgi:MerR family copper efflux transcriptional regulator
VAEEWQTLAAVAARLGVSERTARRWIREGKIHAELREGPDGVEYHVHEGQIETAAAIRLHMPEDASLDDFLDEREGNVISLLEDLRDRLEAATEGQTSLEERLREEMREIHDQLEAGIEALKHARVHESAPPPEPTPRRWWWPFGK